MTDSGQSDTEKRDLIGICFTCEERFWFEATRVGELCPEDHGEDDEHEVSYYERVKE